MILKGGNMLCAGSRSRTKETSPGRAHHHLAPGSNRENVASGVGRGQAEGPYENRLSSGDSLVPSPQSHRSNETARCGRNKRQACRTKVVCRGSDSPTSMYEDRCKAWTV
jgi:hypothetical protein